MTGAGRKCIPHRWCPWTSGFPIPKPPPVDVGRAGIRAAGARRCTRASGISHRGLAGSDYRACSYIFFYVVSGMALRGNVKKVLEERGITPKMPKGASTNPFGLPSQEEMDRKWGKMK